MEESFILVRIDDFFQTTLMGTVDIARSVSILEKILELEKARPGIAIVIDARRSTRALEYRDFMDLAEIMAASELNKRQPIALINRIEDIYYSKFLEANLAERGFFKFKAFDSLELAFEWLQSTPGTAPVPS